MSSLQRMSSIPQQVLLLTLAKSGTDKCAQIHLAPPTTISTFTFADLGMREPGDEARIAGSNPFPFLSWEGVLAYRRSILSPEVVDNCARSFGKGALLLRDVSSRSKFIKDLWTHPKTLDIVRSALGVDIDIIMPYEIGHTNIQLASPDMPLSNLQPVPQVSAVALTDEQKSYDPLSADSVIPWHYDSYPFVAIIMLSHTDSMIGGHTYIQTADGKPRKVDGPSIGSAVVLQGGRVRHLASRSFGSSERITAITSFRLSKPGVWDDSYISNVRPYDVLPALYRGWSLYRLEKMRDEIECLEQRLKDDSQPFHDEDVTVLCSQLADYSTRTARQMTSPIIRDEVVARFGHAKVASATEAWRKMRNDVDVRDKTVTATERTAIDMPGLKPLLLDWHHTKAAIALGVPQMSMGGPFEWQARDEYFFPDELARQGLNELLLLWLDRFGLVAHM
ncbi:hypothetical protein PRZ48_015249 [Zasmidium cellare]|uniref:Fe2OG dioxygenase domain-containing protein n=1 Tax=Zasmidium cellare TaxID=395010 RepID=A0ABR0DWP7_ZASCE|nr:hypothetical protein PRZ48_015249 [Zasmidium cellare]